MSGWTTIVAAETLAVALWRPDVVVVDCRHRLNDPGYGQSAWLSAHIPGAAFAHLDRDLAESSQPQRGRHPLPDCERFCEILGKWGISPAHQVVAYDERDGSMAAARLWFLLRLLGHERVAVLDGGFARWGAQGLPTSSTPTRLPAARYRGQFDSSRLLDCEQVQQRLSSGRSPPPWLIDARSAERFSGEVEMIDRLPGHIPGAINRPYTENLTADGRMRSPSELASAFRSLTDGRDPSEFAVMCGSGVTACHHLLAMERAGLTSAKLFEGSWSGWISDHSRPIATGH